MAGSLALGEYLAGAVVALMLAGGNALEAAANSRARRALTELLARAPTVAHRRVGAHVEDIAVDDLGIGDTALVRTGEVLPVDGVVVRHHAVLGEATLTGESLPVICSTSSGPSAASVISRPSSWSATASTTPRRWRWPTWASRWARAGPPRRRRPPTP
jgi:cation transport ATPase